MHRPPIDVPEGPVDLAEFLRGYWTGTAVERNCHPGSTKEDPYIWGSNRRYEVNGDELHEYFQKWGGPGYNCTSVTRYRIVSVDRTRKEITVPYSATQVAEIELTPIDDQVLSGGCSTKGLRQITKIPLTYANIPTRGFSGRGFIGFSCEGEFRYFDKPASATQGVR